LTRADLNCDIENRPFPGQFDATTLTEAFEAITEEATSGVPQRDLNKVSLHVSLADSTESPRAMVEWRGVKPGHRNPSFTSFHDHATVPLALAAKIIEAHGGQIERDANTIRVSLPLSD
jgi:nitrogen fixation/metabolism regulation signal transduction histidine kinase